MIKRILVATSLLCMCCILFAQNVQVKGKVVSENEAVEFANVVLQTKDSIFIAGVYPFFAAVSRLKFAVLNVGDLRRYVTGGRLQRTLLSLFYIQA